MVSRKRGPDGLTDYERDICHAIDQGMTYLDAHRKIRPHSKASDNTAERNVWRVRSRPHCVAYMNALKAKSLARHLDRKDRIIEELALVAFSDIGDLLTYGPDGLTVKPLDELAPAQRRTLARVAITKTAHGGTVRVALHDKLSALDKLCKLFGLYAPAGAYGGEEEINPVSQMSDIERAQRLAAILRLGREQDTTDT